MARQERHAHDAVRLRAPDALHQLHLAASDLLGLRPARGEMHMSATPLTGPSILALVGRQQTGPDLWRVLQPVTALEKQGYPAGWDFKDADLLGLVAAAAECILMPRMEWPPEYRRVAEAWFQKNRQDGKTVIYDADDDIFTAAETQRRVELGWMEGRTYEQLEASRYERIWAMQQADGCTVSTQRLATIVRSFTTKPVIVVPNAIDLKWFRGVVKATSRQIPGLTIGWAGGRPTDRRRLLCRRRHPVQSS
jgi:hypothetical protein